MTPTTDNLGWNLSSWQMIFFAGNKTLIDKKLATWPTVNQTDRQSTRQKDRQKDSNLPPVLHPSQNRVMYLVQIISSAFLAILPWILITQYSTKVSDVLNTPYVVSNVSQTWTESWRLDLGGSALPKYSSQSPKPMSSWWIKYLFVTAQFPIHCWSIRC
jgi:hypothetical protein